MSSDHERYERLILSNSNHEKWFRKIQFKAQANGYFYVTQTTKEVFSWIAREGGVIREEKAKKDPSSTDINPMNDLSSKFEKLGGSVNREKAQAFDRDSAKFFSLLTDYLGDDDQAVFDQFERPNEIWKSLKDKYSEASAASASHFMKKIQKFPEEYDIDAKGITNAWQTLKGYAVKLGNADESFRNAYSEKFLFLILIKMLSDKYTSLLDGFRLRPELTAQEKVTILEDKERDLKSTEQAYAVFDKQRRRREHRSSDVSMPDLPQEILCYKCDGDDHLAKACPFSDEIKAYGIALRKKFEKRNLKSRKIKPPKTSSARKAEKKTRSNRPTKSRKSHSYTACEDSSSKSDSSTDEDLAELSESDSDRPPAQKVMLSKALIREN